MRYGSGNYEDEKSRSFPIGRMLLLLIPIVNVTASMVWAFGSGDRSTRLFGKISLLILTILTGWGVYFGVSGVQELIAALSS